MSKRGHLRTHAAAAHLSREFDQYVSCELRLHGLQLHSISVSSTVASPPGPPSSRWILVTSDDSLMLILLTPMRAATNSNAAPIPSPLLQFQGTGGLSTFDRVETPRLSPAPAPVDSGRGGHQNEFTFLLPHITIPLHEGPDSALFCPVDPSLFATTTKAGKVFLHEIVSTDYTNPQFSTEVHKRRILGAFGRHITWHSSNRNVLAVATATDLTIIEDVWKPSAEQRRSIPICSSDLVGIIRDAQFGKQQENLIAVSAENGIFVFDVAERRPMPIPKIHFPALKVSPLDFHPLYSNVLAFGSQYNAEDEGPGTVNFLDVGKISQEGSSTLVVGSSSSGGGGNGSPRDGIADRPVYEVHTMGKCKRIRWRNCPSTSSANHFLRSTTIVAECCDLGRAASSELLTIWDAAIPNAPLAQLQCHDQSTRFTVADFSWCSADELVVCANARVNHYGTIACVRIVSVLKDFKRVQGGPLRSALTFDPLAPSVLSVSMPGWYSQKLWGGMEDVESNAVLFGEESIDTGDSVEIKALGKPTSTSHTPPTQSPQPQSISKFSQIFSSFFSATSKTALLPSPAAVPDELEATPQDNIIGSAESCDATPPPTNIALGDILRQSTKRLAVCIRSVAAHIVPNYKRTDSRIQFQKRVRELDFGIVNIDVDASSSSAGVGVSPSRWATDPFSAFAESLKRNSLCFHGVSPQCELFRSLHLLVPSCYKFQRVADAATTMQLQLLASHIESVLDYISDEICDAQFSTALFMLSRRFCVEVAATSMRFALPLCASMNASGDDRRSSVVDARTHTCTIEKCFERLLCGEMERRGVEWAVDYADELERDSLFTELCELRLAFPPRTSDDGGGSKGDAASSMQIHAMTMRDTFRQAQLLPFSDVLHVTCGKCETEITPKFVQDGVSSPMRRSQSARRTAAAGSHSSVLAPSGSSLATTFGSSPKHQAALDTNDVPSAALKIDQYASRCPQRISANQCSTHCDCVYYTCVVCQRGLQAGEVFWWLRPCGHGGHVGHIAAWIDAGGDKCPACATPLSYGHPNCAR